MVRMRVGKRRTVVIPKEIAEKLGVEEGMFMEVEVEEDRIVLKPESDAISIAMRGKKVAKTTLEELERISLEEQKI
ncbi:AbrB family transcriptional regulator [Archaeoglobales archaeon]|nr:MAG: AbrB family transcriptional regulator [Archaeoglobales archaeon]